VSLTIAMIAILREIVIILRGKEGLVRVGTGAVVYGTVEMWI